MGKQVNIPARSRHCESLVVVPGDSQESRSLAHSAGKARIDGPNDESGYPLLRMNRRAPGEGFVAPRESSRGCAAGTPSIRERQPDGPTRDMEILHMRSFKTLLLSAAAVCLTALPALSDSFAPGFEGTEALVPNTFSSWGTITATRSEEHTSELQSR